MSDPNLTPFAIHPGEVMRPDGDFHYIEGPELASLFGLQSGEFFIWDDERPETFLGRRPEDYRHLYARADGNYWRPGRGADYSYRPHYRPRINPGAVRRALAQDRLAALKLISWLPGTPAKRFVMDTPQGAALTERQMQYLEILAWRYRRQIPLRLVPGRRPDDLPPKEVRAAAADPEHTPAQLPPYWD